MTTVAVVFCDYTTREVEAEPTSVPGLYVVPVTARPWRWHLVHGPSGRVFPYEGSRPGICQLLARAMRKVRADWTDLSVDADSWPTELLMDIQRVGGEWECRHHRRPYPVFFWRVKP